MKILKKILNNIKSFIKKEQALAEDYRKQTLGDPTPVSLNEYRKKKKLK